MKHYLIAATLLYSVSANATVGVALGANKWADDGFPDLAPKEQAKAFICHGPTNKMTGPQAVQCALKKCLAYFKVPKGAKIGKNEIVSGKCKPDGWAERSGVWAIGYVGAPGDNDFIFSKALGDKERAEALNYVHSNGFPVKPENKAFDFYDDGSNGIDTYDGNAVEMPRMRGMGEPNFNEHGGMVREQPL